MCVCVCVFVMCMCGEWGGWQEEKGVCWGDECE